MHSTTYTQARSGSERPSGITNGAQSFVMVLLKDISIHRLRLAHDTTKLHVQVSVDGKVQFRSSETTHQHPGFTWTFPEPIKLYARASSTFKFCVYREPHHLHNLREHQVVGQYENKLGTFLNPEKQFRIGSKSCPTSTIQVNLGVDYVDGVLDVTIPFAAQQVRNLAGDTRLQMIAAAANASSPIYTLGYVIHGADKMMGLLDSMAELHAFCKAAIVILKTIYNAVKTQTALDASLQGLVEELCGTLDLVNQAQDIKNLPGAGTTVQAVIQLVIDAAVFIDEWVHTRTMKRILKCAAFERRIRECMSRLSALRMWMSIFIGFESVVHSIMTVHNDEVAHLLERLQPLAQQTANTTAVSFPGHPVTGAALDGPCTSAAAASSVDYTSPAECHPVEKTSSQDTQRSGPPPYTSHQEPLPPFSLDAPVTLLLNDPLSAEPAEYPSAPLPPSDLGFSENANVLLILDPALSHVPLDASPQPTYRGDYVEEKKVEVAAPEARSGSRLRWKRHGSSATAVA